jgi:hypothetical protein
MLPESPALVVCPACNAHLWIASLRSIGEHDWYRPMVRQLVGQRPIKPEQEPPAEWRNAPQFHFPKGDELAQALDAGVADTPERERYLRVRLWWGLNDPHRGDDRPQTQHGSAAAFQSNLERLGYLLDGSPNDKLLRAEIARESSSFTRSIELCDVLIGVYVVAHLKETAALIRGRALQRDARVFRLDPATVETRLGRTTNHAMGKSQCRSSHSKS